MSLRQSEVGGKLVFAGSTLESVGQLTRFKLRLRLRQQGAHFLSDLTPGDAGAWDEEPCFLCGHKEKPDTEAEKREEEVRPSFCSPERH